MTRRGLATYVRNPRLRALAAVLALLLLVRTFLPVLRAWESERLAEALAARGDLATVTELATASGLTDSAQRSSSERESARATFSGATPASAASAMSGRLQQLARERGFVVRELTMDADSSFEAPVERLHVRVVGVGDTRSVPLWLADIEAATPYMRVMELVIVPAAPVASSTALDQWRVSARLGALAVRAHSPREGAP